MCRLAVAFALSLWSAAASAMVWPNAIESVAADLASSDVGVRRAAAGDLHRLPRSAVRRLLPAALSDADPQVRVAAAEAAILVRFEPAAKVVKAWLSDTDARVRQIAAQLLGFFPLETETLTNLGRALTDPQAEVRLAAAQALGASRSLLATLPLLGHLDDSNPQVQVAVVRALERLQDPRSIMPLVGKIQDPRSAVRRAVATTLGALGDARVVPGLVLALRDSDSKVRAAAVQALGKTGSKDAIDALSGVLSDDADPAVQVATLFALAEHNSARTARLVIEALDSPRAATVAAAKQALLRFGPPAFSELEACLRSPPSKSRADGCAQGLATGVYPRAFELISRAWAQRSVTPAVAFQAMADLADSRALPIALEAMGSEDPALRSDALRLADALLRPEVPDGRAVEPLVAALESVGEHPEERIALVALLGKTATFRAAQYIAPFAAAGVSPRLRATAIRALGQVRAASSGEVLMSALSDENPRIRKEAALAIRRAGVPALAPALLDRLEHAAEQDRLALALALSGSLSGVHSPPLLKRVLALVLHSTGAIQDALLEALAQAEASHARAALNEVAQNAADVLRAKIAEVLAGVAGGSSELRGFLKDADGRVRANAAWSLGGVGDVDALPLLIAALREPDVAVVANAAASVARIGARAKVLVTPELCRLLEHPRSYVRANALAGLRVVNDRCKSKTELWLLRHDPSAVVRQRAASLVIAVPRTGVPDDASALGLCLKEETHGSVATACAGPRSTLSRPGASSSQTGTVIVFVSPAVGGAPVPLSPYALQFADDLLRLGVSDRRGAVYAAGAPAGKVRLRVPEALTP